VYTSIECVSRVFILKVTGQAPYEAKPAPSGGGGGGARPFLFFSLVQTGLPRKLAESRSTGNVFAILMITCQALLW
jgi:hypothetical protein